MRGRKRPKKGESEMGCVEHTKAIYGKFIIFYITIFLIIVQTATITWSDTHLKTQPNIVLIVIDALRPDYLSTYGYGKDTDPFMSEISAKGTIFENAYTTCSWTAPSIASLLTSLYPFQHNLKKRIKPSDLNNANPMVKLNKLPQEVTTIAETLKNAGYHTYAVTSNPHLCKLLGFHQGFDKFQKCSASDASIVNHEVRKWAKDIEAISPYFLYIHYMEPHSPYKMRDQWSEQNNEELAYESEIHYVDGKIQELFHLLEWNANTLLIITADHGEEFRDHWRTRHGITLYVEMLHVPLIMYFPKKVKAQRIKDNVSLIDVVPTIREFLCLPRDKENEGISLASLLRAEIPTIERRYLFAYLLREKGEFPYSVFKRSVICGEWHYIISSSSLYERYFYVANSPWLLFTKLPYIINSPWLEELYNLEDDPKECKNQIRHRPEIAKQLNAKLLDFENNCKKYKQESVDELLDNETVESLKTLGYL